jgi:hypothetical protein
LGLVGLVYSIYDSTEAVIQRMIEGKRRFIREDNNDNDENNTRSESQDDKEEKKKEVESRGGAAQEEGIPIIINPAIRAHFQLEIETLQNAPTDAFKLEQIIKAKERENEKARHIEGTQRLVTEIEMLKVVLSLVNRNNSRGRAL